MTSEDSQSPQSEGVRINKYLASCGYESRRKADRLIEEGAVEINGKRVEAPGARVMPGDYVKVNGKHALPKEEVSVLLNKPRGFVCSRDAQGAQGTVYDLLPAKYRFVNYVGRLDTDSEGLLILTNKGELNQRLAHPTGSVEKEYWVTLDQTYDNSVLLQLLKGVRIPEGQAKAKFICRLSPRRACVVLEQGLKRQVRQMFACLGFRVRKLVRVRIGSLWGGDLAPGRAMLLTAEQEQLALTNPAPRKGLISAAQAFPSSGSLSKEQLDRALDEKAARKALEEETDYVFNPDDFETEQEAEASSFRDEDDDFFPAAPGRGRAPRGRGERGSREDGRFSKRAPYRDRDGRSSRDFSRRERSFGPRRREGDFEPRRFSDSSRRDFSRSREDRRPRRDFDNRREEYGSHRSFGERPGRSGFGKSRDSFQRSGRSPQRDRRGGFGAPRRGASSPKRGKRF